jgi:hypothetical protein
MHSSRKYPADRILAKWWPETGSFFLEGCALCNLQKIQSTKLLECQFSRSGGTKMVQGSFEGQRARASSETEVAARTRFVIRIKVARKLERRAEGAS